MVGTVFRIALPKGTNSNQQSLCNGYKRKHVLKFQAITTPDFLRAISLVRRLVLLAESDVENFLADVLKVWEQQYASVRQLRLLRARVFKHIFRRW